MGPLSRGPGWETPIGGKQTQQLELRMVNVMFGSTFTWNWLETLRFLTDLLTFKYIG
jgi:hypothetical protein